MNKRLSQLKKFIADKVTLSLIEDEKRKQLLFVGLNILLALVAFFMTIVNIFTKEIILMCATSGFFVAALLNVFLSNTKINKKILHVCLMIEANALFAFFIISGEPEGFSALWVALMPCFALLIFGRKEGSFYCLLTFLLIVFFFWIPIGRNILQFSYSEVFMLRFPFFYVAIYLISFFMEYIRATTQDRFVDSDNKLRHLYRHDALTGLNNRYGFYEEMKGLFQENKGAEKRCAVVMADIDFFKKVNDEFGHLVGDVVLKGVAQIIRESMCEHTKLCRWGGEEFLMFMGCDHDPKEVCETIRKKIEEHVFDMEGIEIRTTISLGVCTAKQIDENVIEKMIRVADDNLYAAKRNGRKLSSH